MVGRERSSLRQYKADTDVDWTITPEVRELAKTYMGFHELKDITLETLFPCTMFSVLSSRQDYPMHVRLYATLLANGYDNPEKILEDKDKLKYHRCLASASGPNQKRERLVQLSDWWLKSDLPKRVIEDATNGQKEEFSLRDKFSDEAHGVADKGASMLFGHIGYRKVVPIDTWMIKYLRQMGHMQFEQTDYISVGGYKREVYHEAERIMQKDAEKQGISPYMFQVMLWIKATGWTPNRFIDPKSIKLDEQKEIWDSSTLEATVSAKGIQPPPVLRKRWSKMAPYGGFPEIDTSEHQKRLDF